MELRKYCAYNVTRECFLGLEVTAGDFSYHALRREGALTIKANEGLWLTSFRGVPESGFTAPVDLVFLDSENRVVELVESFPNAHPDSSLSAVQSLLVLPAHSIFTSETHCRDQFVLCFAEEMPLRLERLSAAKAVRSNHSETQHTAAAVAAPPETEIPTEAPRPAAQAEIVVNTSSPLRRIYGAPKSWFQRLWSSERRQNPRHANPGLVAYYWDGLPPAAHEVRDISSTGMYLLTEDRWYPGTLILMTLQDQESPNEHSKQAIAVNVRAVRSDNQGVGLEFVLANRPGAKPSKQASDAEQRALARFIQRLGK